MRVQMLVSIGGFADARYGQPDFNYAAGQIVDVNASLAEAWVAAHLAALLPAESISISNLDPMTQFSDNEIPAGVIDGVNDTFTLLNAPNPPSSLSLFNDAGLRLRPGGVDFALTGNRIVYVAGAIPSSGAHHDCSYRF